MNGSRWTPLTLLTIALYLSASAIAQTQPSRSGAPVVIGERLQLHSNLLNETREVIVGKPEGYEESVDRYPVVYLLDGEDNFVHTLGHSQFSCK